MCVRVAWARVGGGGGIGGWGGCESGTDGGGECGELSGDGGLGGSVVACEGPGDGLGLVGSGMWGLVLGSAWLMAMGEGPIGSFVGLFCVRCLETRMS